MPPHGKCWSSFFRGWSEILSSEEHNKWYHNDENNFSLFTSSSLITNQQNMCPVWLPGSPQLLWCSSPPTECDTLASSWLTISYVCMYLTTDLTLHTISTPNIYWISTDSVCDNGAKTTKNYIIIQTTSIATNYFRQKDSRAASPSDPLQ